MSITIEGIEPVIKSIKQLTDERKAALLHHIGMETQHIIRTRQKENPTVYGKYTPWTYKIKKAKIQMDSNDISLRFGFTYDFKKKTYSRHNPMLDSIKFTTSKNSVRLFFTSEGAKERAAKMDERFGFFSIWDSEMKRIDGIIKDYSDE